MPLRQSQINWQPVSTQIVLNASNNNPSIDTMGANDDNNPVDLNRTLPKLPIQLCLDLPPNLSLKPTTNLETYIPTHSTPMSSSSTNNTKQQFQNITRELLLSSFEPESPSSSNFAETLDPVKLSPQNTSTHGTRSALTTESPKSSKMSSYSNSYQGSLGRSPFVDQELVTHTLMEEFYEHRCDSPAKFDENSKELLTSASYHRPKAMSQSRSEGNMQKRVPPTRIETRFDPVLLEKRNCHITIEQENNPLRDSPSRGRLAFRTPSPTKLDDIAENQEMDYPPSPVKRSRSPVKQLFGERGWLGRSTSMKELPSEEYRKTGFKHWGEKLKQKVGEISHKTGEVSKRLPTTFAYEARPKTPPKSKFPISLDPPAQSKLYSEVELMITATANRYLMTQAQAGRMSVESIQKVIQFWTSKNRPQVVEFQFDQLTQHELVQANLKTFRFYGAHAENVISLNTMMISWRTMAKEMSVRTFCTPDSVIRKQLHDCYKILEMLGAPVVTFLAFQEIQVRALATMRHQQERREQYATMKFGVERKWEPSGDGVLGGLLENPFGGELG